MDARREKKNTKGTLSKNFFLKMYLSYSGFGHLQKYVKTAMANGCGCDGLPYTCICILWGRQPTIAKEKKLRKNEIPPLLYLFVVCCLLIASILVRTSGKAHSTFGGLKHSSPH